MQLVTAQNGKMFYKTSNHEDQELEDVRTTEGAMEGNCWASQVKFWVVELLYKK
jgi:hypothetical protein